MKILIFVSCLILGFFCIRYAKWLTDSTGMRFTWFEETVSPGGTYFLVQIIGLAIIIFGFYSLFN